MIHSVGGVVDDVRKYIIIIIIIFHAQQGIQLKNKTNPTDILKNTHKILTDLKCPLS